MKWTKYDCFHVILFCLFALFCLLLFGHTQEKKEQIEDGLLVSPPKLNSRNLPLDTFFLPTGKRSLFFIPPQKSTNTKNVKKDLSLFPLL